VKRRGLSLGWRMVSIIAGLPLLLLTPLLVYFGRQYSDVYRGAFWSKASLATIQIQRAIETAADAPELVRLLQDTDENAEDFDFIVLVDDGGLVIAGSVAGYDGRVLDQLRDLNDGATMHGAGDQTYAVLRRDLGSGETYLIWRSMAMPGRPSESLYIVVGELVSVVEPPTLPLLVIAVVLGVGVVVLIHMSLHHFVLVPLDQLAEGAAIVGTGDLAHRITVESEDELGSVVSAFNDMTDRIGELVSRLESSVAERTQALQSRNSQLEAVTIVGQEAARQRNVNALLDAAVNAITDNFGFYHTGIFILDDSRTWAILGAASSDGGKRMLNRGHRLQVDQVGIVGYVASSGRPRIAHNVGQDSVWFNNPDLPDTRAEMALPLLTDEIVVGVLDVQSENVEEFTDEDITTLQLMADQITVALNNAQALESQEAALRELRELQIDYARSGWARVTHRMRPLAYEYDHVDTTPVPPLPVPQELEEGKVPHKIAMDGATPVVMEALRVGNQTLGYLGLADSSRVWSEEELELVRSVGEQVALALDNARLFEDTQRNERQQYLISSVLQVASDPDLDAAQVLDEIARILANGLAVTVAIFTFPYPNLPVVRSHAVIDPEGRKLPLFGEELTLSQEHYIFFKGLVAPELGPMTPLLGRVGKRSQVQAAIRSYDFDRVLYVPIASAGVRNGFIGLILDQASPPVDPDTRELAQNLASQISVVLENLNLTEETRRRSDELRQLYRISLALSGQLEPTEVLSTIVEQGAGLMNADAANLWVYDADAGRLRLAYDHQGGAEGHLNYEAEGDAGLAGAALAKQQTIFVDDHATWEGHIAELVSLRFRGMMAVPLVGRLGPLGVLVVKSERVGAFAEREAGLADLFSAQAATALENAQFNQDAQRRATEFSQLYDVGIDLITILDAEELLARAADWTRRVFNAERAAAFMLDPQSSHTTQGISTSGPRYLPNQDGDLQSVMELTESIISERESVLVRDNRSSPTPGAARLVDVGLLSQMGTPLRVGDAVLGALLVDGAVVGQFGGRDLTMLEFLAAQISSALQNSLQFGQTEEALVVVGRQARYQENVSQAVALLNERGAEGTQDVLRLLGDASEVPIVLYFEASTSREQEVWRLKDSWTAAGLSPEWLREGLQEFAVSQFPSWLRRLTDAGYIMVTRGDVPDAERALFEVYQFEAILGLAVPGELGAPSFVALFREETELWSEQEVAALQTVAAALSNTLAREQLFEQVQETLSETEALYRGGAALSEAGTHNDVLGVFLEHTLLGKHSQTASLHLFDRSWIGGELPEYSEVVAYWSQNPLAEFKRRYRLEEFPISIPVMQRGVPMFIEDLDVDNPLDRRAQALFRRAVGARSLVIVPLVVGGQRVGYLHADYSEPQVFTEPARRRLTSLAQQAAISVLNIRQLQATEARVRREQLIRQITARVQESPDVEGVLQTAVQELGRAFGTSRSRIQFHPALRDDDGAAPGADDIIV
jgi:GAF domain-containing protein/HAMP domain-containing protein